MRFAVFADIHANLEALTAVIEDAEKNHCTHHVCLGDIVGYNANPRECVDIVRALDCPVVKGNHDEQASIEREQTGFNALAEQAINWTREQLDDERKQWLRDLRMVRQVRDFTVVHATLDTPNKWGYIFNQLDAAASFSYQHTTVCFHGHTHTPRVFVRETAVTSCAFDKQRIEQGKKYFINVGSVGQPRDGDWHAAYAIYHVEQAFVELRRIEYDIYTAQDKIVDAGLPQRLADRLALGK